MLYALEFIAVFTIGGLSGIFVAAFDWQAHDTYFVVATSTTSSSADPCSHWSQPLYYWWPRRCSGDGSTSGSAS